MARKLTAWNKAVAKTFKAGKSKNKDYTFKQALQDASAMQNGGNETQPTNTNTNQDPDPDPDPAESKGGSSPLVGTPFGEPMTVTKHGGTHGPKHSGKSRKHKHHKHKGHKSHKKQKKLKSH
jgi:hypothetical protein